MFEDGDEDDRGKLAFLALQSLRELVPVLLSFGVLNVELQTVDLDVAKVAREAVPLVSMTVKFGIKV